MSETDVLLCDIDAGVATLTLNRPQKRNALNNDLLEALITSLERLAEDRDVSVIVITGAGEKTFCSGGDLTSVAGSDGGMLGLHNARQRFVDLLLTMTRVGKPIIAKVNGHCLAGGLGFMLNCDLVIASDNATFGTPEIKVGLFPMMIMAIIFRNIGRKKGMELILTGERIAADEAERVGLINKVVPRASLDDATRELAARLASYSPAILKLGRDAFYSAQDMDFASALEYLRAQLTLNTLTEDAAEGVTAFIMKRKPEWKGR